MKTLIHLTLLLCFIAIPAQGRASEKLDLSGPWRLRLDPDNRGVKSGWASQPLAGNDTITLPNTTDRAGFGFPLDTATMRYAVPFPVTTRFPGVKETARADERGYLVRRNLHVGPAWYERDFEVPPNWAGRVARLRIERTIWSTDVWVDGRPSGSSDSLVAEHVHDLGPLEPGTHRLTVRVDNRMLHNISTITHAYGPETQSRWNGMVGALEIGAKPALSFDSIAVYPAADRRSARVVAVFSNTASRESSGTLSAQLLTEQGDQVLAEAKSQGRFAPGKTQSAITLTLSRPADAWDEFTPVRYQVKLRMEATSSILDETSTFFGFRQVDHQGRTLRINGRPVFLRGTLDCCVYPETGHPPMTVDAWLRVLGVVKEYGFNHVRFHTWCPPEAAFEVADRVGLYLQPETPAWVDDWGLKTETRPSGIGHDRDVVEYLRAELTRICAAYGNHPSFVMLTIGNEFGFNGTDWACVDRMVEEIRTADPRRLYCGCTARKHLPNDDYWITHECGAATRGVGPAHTNWDFAAAAQASPVPLIAHETGQRPVFPDYEKLLPAFQGPLLPLNFARHQRGLRESGMAYQTQQFVRASALFQMSQYKAEHEAMLRTRGYAGYQLLMLNDFTGQSEAPVGVLDPFGRPKGVVTPAAIRAWNSPTVVLARFPKYVWTQDETFQAHLEVAHYGPHDLTGAPLQWSLTSEAGKVLASGTQQIAHVATGGVSSLGDISAPLLQADHPTALRLLVRLAESENSWDLWVYPNGPVEPEPPGVLVTRVLDQQAMGRLAEGGKVLWLAHGLKSSHSEETRFESVYWSAGWWGNAFSSLGVLCDPRHPALRAFPNDGRGDWQWHDLCERATTFRLDDLPHGFQPIVQLVPDFHFNSHLAQVFEARVGAGSLLVCGYDLTSELLQRPAARQFRRGLFRYVASSEFRPAQSLSAEWLTSAFPTVAPASK